MSANGISRLPTREERQKAKLELAAAKRSKNNNARSIYNINDLPTQYVANSVVDNSTNLSIGRPWVSGNYVKNIITNIFSPSDLMCVVDLNDLTADKLSWRRNLFTYTTDITNTVWLKTGTPTGAPTFIGNVLAPDGTNTAVSYSFSSGNHIRQLLNVTGGIPGTASIWVRKGTTNPAKAIRIVSNNTLAWNTGESTKILLSSEWTRVSATQIVTGTNNQRYIMFGTNLIDGSNDPECNGSIELWRPQYELGSTATDYQPITNFNTEFLNRFPLHALYQDAAGTIPATAVGQPIGLVLDKSKGLVLGPEKVINGDFSNGLTGWELFGGTTMFTAQNNRAYFNGAGSNTASTLRQSTGIQVGKTYLVTFEFEVLLGAFYCGGTYSSTYGGRNITGSGKRQFILPVTDARDTGIAFRAENTTSTCEFYIDNVSVMEITGNHARQTTSASRPVLGRHPVGGARNLLTYSGTVTDASWTFAGGTKTGGQLDSDGGYTATKCVGPTTSPGYKDTTVSTTGVYTYTLCLKQGEKTKSVSLVLRNSTSNTFYPTGVIDLVTGSISGTGWTSKAKPNGFWECVYTSTDVINANSSVRIYFSSVSALPESFDIIVDYAQLEVGSVATNYQETTTLLDITERGKADAWYLKFDGVDDFLVTSSINFTATDKVSLFAGVRKLSDAASGVVVELGTAVEITKNAFSLLAPSSSGANKYNFRSIGSSGDALGTSTIYAPAAPSSDVLTGKGAISTDTCLLRVNGVQVASTSVDQGTGNYGNYPLYIGRRGGTTLPFNGHLYSLVIVSRLSTNSETNAMENAISKQMGVSL